MSLALVKGRRIVDGGFRRLAEFWDFDGVSKGFHFEINRPGESCVKLVNTSKGSSNDE